MEKILTSRRVYDGKAVQVDVVQVALEDGGTREREVVRHKPGVCVTVLQQRGDSVAQGYEVVTVRQFRVPAEKEMTEIVAGIMEDRETPLEAAKRELREETGLEANEWIELGTLYPSPGYLDERMTLYLARDVQYVGDDPDDSENLLISAIPFTLAMEQVQSGAIQDLKSVASLLWASVYLTQEMESREG